MRREEIEETSDSARRRVQDDFFGRKSRSLNREKWEEEKLLRWEWARPLTKTDASSQSGRSQVALSSRRSSSVQLTLREIISQHSPL